MIEGLLVHRDIYGNKWVYAPKWVDTLIYLRQQEIYQHYLTELKHNPKIVTQSFWIRRNMEFVAQQILSLFFLQELTIDDFLEQYPHGNPDRTIVKISL